MRIALLTLHVVLGMAVGALYFASLWWNASMFGQVAKLRPLLASMALRFVCLGAVLAAVSFEGALPLLATAFGALVGRSAVLRWVRVATP